MRIHAPVTFGIERSETFHRRNKLSFGEAQVNLLATSDNHGHIEKLPYVYSTVKANLKDIFPQKLKDSVVNAIAIPGDWFIDLKQKAYKTKNSPESIGFNDIKPNELTAGYYNIHFLNQFMKLLQRKLNLDDSNPFKAFYVPGNHCLEDGDDFLVDVLKQADKNMTTVMTNVNIKRSPVLKDVDRVVEKTIIEVPDSKNKQIKHKVLLLGITNNSVDFYCKGKVNGIDILDRTAKKTEQLDFSTDIDNTCRKLFKLIAEFKEQNPQGAVVVMNHNGNPFSAAVVNHLDHYNESQNKNYKIDVILNGHDHKDQTVYIGKNNTPVVSLGQNNRKFESIKLHFDDDGNLTVKTKNYQVDKNHKMLGNPVAMLLLRLFRLDFKRNISIKITDPQNPEKVLDSITELSCKDIRFKNNALANFVTDAILDRVRTYDKTVQIFGISSSAIRGSLPVNNKKTHNFELINVLCGLNDESAGMMVGNIRGTDIARILIKNVYGNMHNETRNELISWSGIKFNKDKMIDIFKVTPPDSSNLTANDIGKILPYIQIKDPETGKYQKLSPFKEYRIAVPLELPVGKIKEFRDNFNILDCDHKNAKELLCDYFEVNDRKIVIPDPGADERVITWKNANNNLTRPVSLAG